MTRALVVEPEAAAELEDAVLWYERRSPGLGMEFARLVRAVLYEIERTPQQFAEVEPGIRRAIMRRFPFAIFFLLEPERIAVIAIFHHRREPRTRATRR